MSELFRRGVRTNELKRKTCVPGGTRRGRLRKIWTIRILDLVRRGVYRTIDMRVEEV